MNVESSDTRTEVLVRELLAARRPARVASDDLRDRVDAIVSAPPADRVEGHVTLTANSTHLLAGIGVAAAFVIALAAGVARSISIRPGPSGSTPPNATLDLSIDGLGLLAAVNAQAPWVLVVVAVAVLAGLALAHPGRRRLFLIATAVAVVGVGLVLANVGRIEYGSSFGPVSGLDLSAEPPPGSDGSPVYYVTADGQGQFAMRISLHNPGDLPVRVEGIVQSLGEGFIGPRWSAVWSLPEPWSSERVIPFQPVEIPPRGVIGMILVGKPGICALRPSFRLDRADVTGYYQMNVLAIATSVIGWPSTTRVEFPFNIAVPSIENCPPDAGDSPLPSSGSPARTPGSNG